MVKLRLSGWWRRIKGGAAKERRKLFMKHGRLLLEELVAICDGKSNPIKTLSAYEILQATNNFNLSNLVQANEYRCYKGMLHDRLVLIKEWADPLSRSDKVYRDIAVSSMMSGHKSFLKLLGCCLEFTYPVIVCEYSEPISRNPLRTNFCIDRNLPWNLRIRIAKEIANAVTYLHTAFSKTFVYKTIEPRHIFLDDNGKAKLADFGNCVAIPEGETFIKDIVEGTLRYLDPNYMATGIVTENTDTYSFGVFMQVLLTGIRPDILMNPYSLSTFWEEARFIEIVDPRVLEIMGEDVDQERWRIEAFLLLSLRCTGCTGSYFPRMIDVAKELTRLDKSNSLDPSS